MIVVSVIGLLAVLAIPAVLKARRRAQNAAFVNDLRVFTDAGFAQYAITYGNYPADEVPGVLPAGVGDFLPSGTTWAGVTPIGGQWDWDRAASMGDTIYGCYAGLSVVNPSRTSVQMADIDAQIDDGNIGTGRFRQRTGGYIYVVE